MICLPFRQAGRLNFRIQEFIFLYQCDQFLSKLVLVVAGSIELSNLNKIVNDFLEIIEFIEH